MFAAMSSESRIGEAFEGSAQVWEMVPGMAAPDPTDGWPPVDEWSADAPPAPYAGEWLKGPTDRLERLHRPLRDAA